MAGCSRPSKLRLVEITPSTTKSSCATASVTACGSGPAPPPQVMQPNPTRLKPSVSSASCSPARFSMADTTREPGENDVFTHGLACNPRAAALRASRPAAITWNGLLVFVHEEMAAITTSPCRIGRSGATGRRS